MATLTENLGQKFQRNHHKNPLNYKIITQLLTYNKTIFQYFTLSLSTIIFKVTTETDQLY